MPDVRHEDDLARMIWQLQQDVAALKRGVTPPAVVPAAFPGGVNDYPEIVNATYVVSGAQAAERPIWAMPVPALAATTTAAVRIECGATDTWTARLTVVQYNPAQSPGSASGLSGTQTGTQSGSLVYTNSGSPVITAGLLVLYFRLVSGTEARVITTSLVG